MKRLKSKTYAICLENQGYASSLEKRKIYEVLPAVANDPQSMVRIIDESGDDYLFPAKWFALLDLPAKARKALSTV